MSQLLVIDDLVWALLRFSFEHGAKAVDLRFNILIFQMFLLVLTWAHLRGRGDSSPARKKESVFEQASCPENTS